MADGKDLPPTEHRIEKGREDGQVASSQDVMRSAVCLSVFEGCRIVFTSYYEFAGLYFQEFIGQIALVREGHSFNRNNVFVWIIASVAVTMVLASVAVVVWIAASWVQTKGPVFKKHPIELKLDKFDPTTMFKNIFSAKTAVDFIGNIAKAIIVGVIFAFAVRSAVRSAPLAIPGGMSAMSALIGAELISAIRTALVALLCLAVLDFGVQRMLTLRDMKMSFEEMKQEMKEMQGDPEVKQHIRNVGHEILSGEGGKKKDPLAGSNALIVNPTHLAVGLRYVKGEQRLPQIRIKGSDAQAMELIELARDLNVPVIRHIWLARTLYEHDEGDVIPREAFKAVAAVYRMLVQLDQAFEAAKEATRFDGEQPARPVQPDSVEGDGGSSDKLA